MKHRFTLVGCAAAFFWALCGPLSREALETMPLLLFTALLQTGGFLVLLGCALSAKRRVRELLRPSPRRLVVALFYLAYVLLVPALVGRAERRETALAVLMLINLWPAVTLGLGAVLFRRRLTLWFPLGCLCALFGGALIATEGQWAPGSILLGVSSHPLLFGAALLAAMLWSLCANLMERWALHDDGFMPFNLGFAALVACTLSARPLLAGDADLPNSGTLAMVVVCNAAGLLCWEVGLRRGDGPTVVAFAYLVPLLTALASAWWFSLPVGAGTLLASLMIGGGALLGRRGIHVA